MGLGFLLRLLLASVSVYPVFASPPDDALAYFETGQVGRFIGARNVAIQYRVFVNHPTDQAIVILPGYAENAQKHYELIYDFAVLGFSVYTLDHRGMGASGREVQNKQVVHVESFDDYVGDLEIFFKQVVDKGAESQRFLFTHSAGGLIGAKFLAKFPGVFRRAVLSAPLLQLNTGYYPRFIAGGLAFALDSVGRSESYAPGFSDYDPKNARWGKDAFTTSKKRFDAYTLLLQQNPSLVMGGPSVRWISEILGETTKAKITSLAKRVQTPMLVYQAGEDALVLPGGQDLFCKTARSCRLIRYTKARHEIYREVDGIRSDAITRAADFFQKPEVLPSLPGSSEPIGRIFSKSGFLVERIGITLADDGT